MNKSNPSGRLENSKVIAEKINGRAALIGVIALLGAYTSTGQIIPGFL
ncbi:MULTISPECIES: high light inducible protein [Prochlorococcus]|nr:MULTISPECIES: high light inducible protein [Prochlorococcus]KGG14152.1 High light inducible protein hli10 [Prochlorococcus sp. MIT 0601]